MLLLPIKATTGLLTTAPSRELGKSSADLAPMRPIPSGVEWVGSESFRRDYRMSDTVIRKFLQWGYI